MYELHWIGKPKENSSIYSDGPNYLSANLQRFSRPGRSTMAIWNDEEYLVANLIDKTDYARSEICKFN